MAMLAEPRRKQKVINLRAKNNAWSNDNTKFGQRMLEKMGWTSGKGLGANENGIVEHVVARYKNDDKGLGFEDRNDQWTKHEDDFNSLLANLSNGDATEEKLHSGVSLEVKSKKSKARVHYHKFTRGKDLTRYSEKDLANIFGKKTLSNKEETPQVPKKEDLKTTEVIFTEKGSMVDYFKNKLAMKGKTKMTLIENCNDDEAGYAFKGFAGTGNDEVEEQSGIAFQGFSFYNKSVESKTSEQTEINDPVKKKSKKNKKSKKDIEEIHDSQINNNLYEIKISPEDEENDVDVKPKKKKSKKNKFKIEEDSEEPQKNKLKINYDESNQIIEEPIDVPKKKKKRKNKDKE